jgi:hypothetical protein
MRRRVPYDDEDETLSQRLLGPDSFTRGARELDFLRLRAKASKSSHGDGD